MSDLDRAAVLDALDAVYQNLIVVAGGLGDADMMRPSRCAGWAVADRQGLGPLATRSRSSPDRIPESIITGRGCRLVAGIAPPASPRPGFPRARPAPELVRRRTQTVRWPTSDRV